MPGVWGFGGPVGTVRTIVPLMLGGALVVGLAGCTDTPATPKASTYTAPVSVIQPGRPGETATTVAPGQTAARPPEASWNGADLYFVSMMVVHHTQALRMARLAAGRTSNPKVQAVAERVLAAQAPEIQTLKAWLGARQQKVPDSLADAGHAHAGMPGAVTPARLAALARAQGTDFDRQFLDLMMAHHAGAVQMAGTVTTAGTDLAVQEIAAEVSVGQNAEIRRMEAIRAAL
jgi:uncharacterized protein (DUF305 family)